MAVHIEEIVLRAHITDDAEGLSPQDPFGTEETDEDARADLMRRMILDECARMIRDALNRHSGR